MTLAALLLLLSLGDAAALPQTTPRVEATALKPGAESVIVIATSAATSVEIEVLVNGVPAGKKTFAAGGQLSVPIDRKLATGDAVRVRETYGGKTSDYSSEVKVPKEPPAKPSAPVIVGERLRAGARTVSVQTATAGEVKVFMEGRNITASGQSFDAGGDITVMLVQPLAEGAHLRAQLIAKGEPSDLSPEKEVPFSTDWGRVRAQFWGGAMVSRSNEDRTFKERDPYLAMTVETALRGMIDHDCACETGSRLRRWQALTETEIRMTSTAVSKGAVTPENGSGAGPENLTTADSALFRGSLLIPFRFANFGTPISGRPWADGEDVLFLAPIVTWGFESVNDTALDEDKKRQLFEQVTVGVRFGHARVSRDSDSVNQTFNYVTVGYTWAENYRSADGAVPRRLTIEARLRVPGLVPLVIGTDLNRGDGEDDARFIFGTTFDIGNVLKKLAGS